MVRTMVVLAMDADKPGLIDTLPPWGLVVAGLVLLAIAGTLYWIDQEKFDGNSIFLEIAALICGFGGIFALYQGIFGG